MASDDVFRNMTLMERTNWYWGRSNQFIPGMAQPSFWGRGVPLSLSTGFASRAAANSLRTNTIFDAFSSVRTFIPALRVGIGTAFVGTGVSAAGFEGGLYLGAFATAVGDEFSWMLFPDPD
jgi:hypothetical protein